MKNNLKYLLFLLSLMACGNEHVFEASFNFENNSWQSFQKVEFEFPAEKLSKTHNVYLEIVYTNSFPYEYLDFTSQITSPGGEERLRAYHEKLRNKNEIYAVSKSEEIFTKKILLTQLNGFSTTSICKLIFENRMDKLETPGIKSLKIIVSSI
jgi:gliding motility-associated lipoprotein GldH